MEVAYAIEGSRRGETTISVLRLNREDLIESRRDRLRPLLLLKTELSEYEHTMMSFRSKGLPVPNPLLRQWRKIRDLLQIVSNDAAEYASMSRAAME